MEFTITGTTLALAVAIYVALTAINIYLGYWRVPGAAMRRRFARGKLQRLRARMKPRAAPTGDERAMLGAWKDTAGEVVNADDLAEFVKYLARGIRQNGDTVPHALHAVMRAAFVAMSYEARVPLTQVQTDALGWMLVRDFFIVGPNDPLRLVNYAELLNPECADTFTAIPPTTWERVRENARAMLTHPILAQFAGEELRAHWQSVAEGNVPFGLRVAKMN
jgi:hypothetical protein